MVAFLTQSYDSSRHVLNAFKFIEFFIRKSKENIVAVVQPGRDERMKQFLSTSLIKVATYFSLFCLFF